MKSLRRKMRFHKIEVVFLFIGAVASMSAEAYDIWSTLSGNSEYT